MSDLVVIVPSRGRPGNMRRLVAAWDNTAASADLWCCIDDDDPELDAYESAVPHAGRFSRWVAPRIGLAATLNGYSGLVGRDFRYLGFMGDDHLPQTAGWDKRICETLDELGTGIVYGNDLFQGERLPTAVFLTADIVATLGYMCPPGLRHMFLDNTWLAWGQGIDRIRYLPDVIIEHLHPHAGKGQVDDGYDEVWPLMGSDGEAFRRYMADQYPADISKLQALL